MPVPRPSRRSYRFLNRRVTVAAASACVLLFLGCMNFTFQGRTVSVENGASPGVSCQSGTAHLAGHACADVYYPAAFATKPNLELEDSFDHCEIVEQREDGFRVRNRCFFSVDIVWKARGTRVEAVVPAAVVAPAPAANSLPPEPVPATLPKPLPANP
jgi:hypothetical protein